MFLCYFPWMPSNLNYTQQLLSEVKALLFCCTSIKCEKRIHLLCSPHMALNINTCLCTVDLFIAWNIAIHRHSLEFKALHLHFTYLYLYHILARVSFSENNSVISFNSQILIRTSKPNKRRAKVGPFWFLQHPCGHKMILLVWNGRGRNRVIAEQRDRRDILIEQLESVLERGYDSGRKVMCSPSWDKFSVCSGRIFYTSFPL